MITFDETRDQCKVNRDRLRCSYNAYMFDQMKQMKQIMGMLGNLGDLKEKAEQMQDELARKTVEAEAGAGAVRVVMNGTFQVRDVQIDPSMVGVLAGEGTDEDRQMIEALMVSAFNAALEKAQAMARDHMAQITGGLDLPEGFNLPQ